jgi:hypothetical protein
LAAFLKIFKGIPSFSHPERYEYQIRKLITNAQGKGFGKLFALRQRDIPLFNFNFDAHNLANAIAADIRLENYTLSSPSQRIIQSKTKQRLIYDYNLTDKIVIGAISQLLNELLENIMSQSSYAFRVGFGPYNVLTDLSTYIRRIRNMGKKEIYLFKTDFVGYSDRIHVAPNSFLWSYIDELMARNQVKPSKYQMGLIQSMIRPEYFNLDERQQCNSFGAPTGTAIITFVNNLYAFKVDDMFEDEPDIFYARYCDDILILHPDPAQLKVYVQKLESFLKIIRLDTNTKKNILACLNTSGGKTSIDGFTSLNYFDYLGYRMSGHGTISISKQRERKFIRLMIQRIKDVTKTLQYKNIDEAAFIICHSLNHYYVNRMVGENSARSIIKESSNHGQLQHIDYLIALEIAKALTKIPSVKAFRVLSYKEIREVYGLKSLLQIRNYSK